METSPNITLDRNLSASSSILSDFLDEELATDLTEDSSVIILQTNKKSYQELEQENAKLTQLLLLQLREVENEHKIILTENEQLSKENRELQRQAEEHKALQCKYEALKQRLKLAGLAEMIYEGEASSGPISSENFESNEMIMESGLDPVVVDTTVASTGSYEEIPVVPSTSASSPILPDLSLQHGVDETKSNEQGHFCFCICGMKFKTKILLTDHIRYFSSKDTLHFACTVKGCGKRFYRTTLLKKHMKDRHDLEYAFSNGCRKCGQTFSSRSQLGAHQKMQHPRQPNNHSVEVQPPSLHIKKASGLPMPQQHGKDFSKADARGRTRSCLCGRKFAKESTLKSHLYYNPNHGSNFLCVVCQSKFPNTFLLRRHMKQKHQLNFSGNGCTKCGKLFANMKELTKHKQKAHSGNQATPSSTSSNSVFNGSLAETPISSV